MTDSTQQGPGITPAFPLLEDLQDCLLEHRHGMQRRLRALQQRRRRSQPFQRGVEKLQQQIEQSRAVVAARRALQPRIEFPEELPISAAVPRIAALLREHQVLVVCGETGSGKSTQLPKIALAEGRGLFGRIGHTQPRRIAARSLSSRIASELQAENARLVGYKVRFHDQVRPETRIKLMTDGILLAEAQQDRLLQGYDTLIVDEAHERSLNIDFLLGYLKNLLPRRPDLKLVITSATIDPQRFARHFDEAPVVEVSGRTYPVEVRYRPPEREGCGERDEEFQAATLAAVDELLRERPGDILIFLSGEREIRDMAEALRKHALHHAEVLPLYARLSPADQARIFRPHARRRILLATNVAETSLTVPGIRHVIDSGFARISRYSHRSKIQRLPVEFVSQASANQRKGRCGREAPGVCIRLYSEDSFDNRRPFTEPEILRTNLAAVILQMKYLRFGELEDFPFVEQPDTRLIKDGYQLLDMLGALNERRALTPIGEKLARLPLDPRLARMLLAAGDSGCLRELLIIASVLSIQDPRERPMDKQQAADEIHATFADAESDFVGMLNLWTFLLRERRQLSRRQFQKLCQRHFLSWNRVQEWLDVHTQLKEQMLAMGYRENQQQPDAAVLHSALLTGLPDQIGYRDDNREYRGIRNSRFHIHPGSALFATGPRWIMAAERVETSRSYARMVAKIQPQWVEAIAGHLLQWSYAEAHWQEKQGQVAAYGSASLFGLLLVPRRRVNFGPIDPVKSREIFIRFALVEQTIRTRAPFFRHNRQLRDYVEHLEHKSRRRDMLVDQESIYAFYDARIPTGIYSTASFERWLRQATRQQPNLLHMDINDLLQEGPNEDLHQAFPDHLSIEGSELPLSYHFEPGSNRDGVNLMVPLSLFNQVSAERCDWPVPGLAERIEAELRALPKGWRKRFVPIPETASALVTRMSYREMPFVQALAEELFRFTGERVPESEWNSVAVDDHLRIGVQLLDEDGQTLAEGKDIWALKRQYSDRAEGAFARQTRFPGERDGLKDWDFEQLPESVPLRQGKLELVGYPALVDQRESVAIRILDSMSRAEQTHRAGVRRLIQLRLAANVRYLKKNLRGLSAMQLCYAAAPDIGGVRTDDLRDQLVALIVEQTFMAQPLRDRQGFEKAIEQGRGRMMEVADQVLDLVASILEHYRQAGRRLASITQGLWQESLDDIRGQLDLLVFKGFLLQVPLDRLRRYPVYLEAVDVRLQRLTGAARRDRERLDEFRDDYLRWQAGWQRAREQHRSDPRLEEIRWLFEELRISLFAQPMKTSGPVSVQRIRKRWRDLGL
jgi:ATP-dependent helicase HrpA